MAGKTGFYIGVVVSLFLLVTTAFTFTNILGCGFWFLILTAVMTAINIYGGHRTRKQLEEAKKLAEELFPLSSKRKTDKIDILLRPTPTYDRLNRGFSDKTASARFWVGDRILRGILDIEHKVLYLKEPVMMSVYRGESIPVWEEVTEVHKNGMPKKVEFYDEINIPHRMDYLDEKGNIRKGSWRRVEGVVEYWNSKAQVWEPVP